ALTTLFAIASTSNTGATTTLFNINNQGLITGLAFSLGSGTTTSLAITGSSTISGFFNATNGAQLASTTLLGSTLLTNATTTSFATLGSTTIGGQFNATNGATFAGATSTSIFTKSLLANIASFGQTGTTTITSPGLLGVGSSSPYALLSVHNASTSALTTLFAIASTSNTG